MGYVTGAHGFNLLFYWGKYFGVRVARWSEDNTLNSLLYYHCLLSRYFRQGISELVSMIETDWRHYNALRPCNNISGVKSSSKTAFQNHVLAVLFLKFQEGQKCNYVKEANDLHVSTSLIYEAFIFLDDIKDALHMSYYILFWDVIKMREILVVFSHCKHLASFSKGRNVGTCKNTNLYVITILSLFQYLR